MSARNGSVKTGIDVLEEHGFDVLQVAGRKKRIGLLTNQTGVDSNGQRTIDVLAKAPGVSLDAIFSPEHGVTGTLDTTDVNNSKDAATGIPVYSVYGVEGCGAAAAAGSVETVGCGCGRYPGRRGAVLYLRNDARIFSGAAQQRQGSR